MKIDNLIASLVVAQEEHGDEVEVVILKPNGVGVMGLGEKLVINIDAEGRLVIIPTQIPN